MKNQAFRLAVVALVSTFALASCGGSAEEAAPSTTEGWHQEYQLIGIVLSYDDVLCAQSTSDVAVWQDGYLAGIGEALPYKELSRADRALVEQVKPWMAAQANGIAGVSCALGYSIDIWNQDDSSSSPWEPLLILNGSEIQMPPFYPEIPSGGNYGGDPYVFVTASMLYSRPSSTSPGMTMYTTQDIGI